MLYLKRKVTLPFEREKSISVIKVKGGINMAYTTNYIKPSMVGLPADLGKAIFEQILNTPKPDDEKLEEQANMLEEEMIRIRCLEDERNSTK